MKQVKLKPSLFLNAKSYKFSRVIFKKWSKKRSLKSKLKPIGLSKRSTRLKPKIKPNSKSKSAVKSKLLIKPTSSVKSKLKSKSKPKSKLKAVSTKPESHAEIRLRVMRKVWRAFSLGGVKTLQGKVVSIKDGVAKVLGLKTIKSGEMVYIGATNIRDHKANGMVLSLNKGYLSIVFFDGALTNIKCGDRVQRSFRLTSIPISLNLLGRTIDALASPLDGKSFIKSKRFQKVDTKAIGIIPRESVREPMQTGVVAVDALTPIGCGQRELIIGDRQTGKTSLALDSIITQLSFNTTYCIYVGIGQKKASVAKIHDFFFGLGLFEKQSRNRLVLICSSSSDSAVLQFLAPYTGCTIGE